MMGVRLPPIPFPAMIEPSFAAEPEDLLPPSVPEVRVRFREDGPPCFLYDGEPVGAAFARDAVESALRDAEGEPPCEAG